MSGHSRWAQIKHKKALSDSKKGNLFSKVARLIVVAAKESGPDPETNAKLRMAIEKARSAGMPKDNIARAIERGAGKDENAEALTEVAYEAYGPGGAAMLIQGVTDNTNRTTNEIKHILSDYGGKLAANGSVSWMFEKNGAVDIETKMNAMPREELLLALIDAGARDVREYPEGITAYVDAKAIAPFTEKLKERNIAYEDAYIDFLPRVPFSLPQKERAALETLLAALDEHEDVQEVYTNASL